MSLLERRRSLYESHLKHAKEAGQARDAALQERKLDEKSRRRDSVVRRLKAVERKYQQRLRALAKVDAVNADLDTRRAERAATPKAPKVKKAKAAPPAPKAAKKERAAKA